MAFYDWLVSFMVVNQGWLSFGNYSFLRGKEWPKNGSINGAIE